MLAITPGLRTSEFRIAVLIATLLGVNADQHWVGAIYALIMAAPGIGYIISRGLAKTVPRDAGNG